jgi:dTDP-glucose pyrophosphorylase
MAGHGSRFAGSKFSVPKPLIDVSGLPMYRHAIDSIHLNGKIIAIKNFETQIPEAQVEIFTDQVLSGPAVSALMAEQYIDNDDELIILNSDQIISWNVELFENARNHDGAIWLFESSGTRWSYASISNGIVSEVAEKREISNLALCGIHYWKHGKDFVKHCKLMIKKRDLINNEYYVAPVYNYAINDNLKILPIIVDQMIDLGTPEGLEKYLSGML